MIEPLRLETRPVRSGTGGGVVPVVELEHVEPVRLQFITFGTQTKPSLCETFQGAVQLPQPLLRFNNHNSERMEIMHLRGLGIQEKVPDLQNKKSQSERL
jgi:hypothetical protein